MPSTQPSHLDPVPREEETFRQPESPRSSSACITSDQRHRGLRQDLAYLWLMGTDRDAQTLHPRHTLQLASYP